MRRKIILGAVVVILVVGGYVGYLLARDDRQFPLSKGSMATIGGTDTTMLEDSSSEEMAIPRLKPGDQIKIIDDSAGTSTDRMRKVSVSVESGDCKGQTGKVSRLYLRPAHWWQ